MADLDMTVVRLRHLTNAPRVVGEAVLRNFPLRPWDRQQEHMDAIMRELQLVLGAVENDGGPAVPRHLASAVQLSWLLFGTLAEAVAEARGRMPTAHADRVDVCVPLVDRTPDLIDGVDEVLAIVDEYCAGADLLTLARPADMVALGDWVMSELVGQYYGAAPTVVRTLLSRPT